MTCENCDKFKLYEEEVVRVPDNCVSFLCNDDKCPNKESITNKFETVCESLKKMTDYDEAKELLYMFYYSGGKYQKEIFETLVLHLKEKIK